MGGACRKGWLKPALKMMASTVFVSNNFHLSAHFTLSQIFCPVFTSLCFGILCQFRMMSYDDRVFLEFMACVMRGAIWYHFCNLKTWKHPWRSDTFSNFTKSNTPPWVFFTFLNCTNGTKSRNAPRVFVKSYFEMMNCMVTTKIYQ